MAHKQLAFSREAEAEADRVGLRILARAGFNPKAMPSFLAKLEQFSDSNNADVREFLQNHPLTIKRVSDTHSRAARLGAYNKKVNANYLYMKEKIRVLARSNEPTPNNIPKNIKKYANALRLEQRNNLQGALQLTGSKSRNIPEAILIGKLLNKQRRYKETLTVLKPLLDIYIGNEALSTLVAQAYISTGQTSKAWSTINEINVTEQTSLEFFEIKQEVARLTGHRSEAYRAAAEKNIRMGNYRAATSLLRQAIKLPSSNASELLEMQRLLAQIKS
jgi:predicted Zn-dependent protease